jgi:hypothetical protein
MMEGTTLSGVSPTGVGRPICGRTWRAANVAGNRTPRANAAAVRRWQRVA